MKTNLDSKFKADTSLETNGVWITIEEHEGVSFLVRRYGGKNSQKVREANARFSKPFANKIASNSLTAEESEDIALRAFCSACLVDWKGVKDENGQEIPCSFDTAVEILSGLPELTDTLFNYSRRFETYRESVGNSSPR